MTVAVADRRPVFERAALASAAVDAIVARAEADCVPVLAYCVMPDDVHLVVEPSERCDVPTFVGRFKSVCLRASWTLGVTGTFWQRSFWDRMLRADEDVTVAVDYVLQNPVRRGMVIDWKSYPYSGSLVFALRAEPEPRIPT